MKIKILEKKDEPLLRRQNIKIEVEFEKEVPSRALIREHVAKALKAEQDMVVVYSINSSFGSRKADVIVHYYSDKKFMQKVVNEHMNKRHAPKEAEKK
jgi:ribosomal protein S24E